MGDTTWDVTAAGKAGMRCVTVLTGGNCRHELLEAGAVGVYADAADLNRQYDTSPLGRLTAGSRA